MEHTDIAAEAATESRASFTCEPRALADAVNLLAMRVIDKRGSYPILSHVMIEALPDGTLRLQGTDLDLQATVTIAADVEMPGAFCTDAANLKAMLAKLKKVDRDALRFEDAQPGRAVLVIGRNRFNLPTLPVDDFPRLNAPTVGTKGPLPLSAFTVPRVQLVQDLAALAPCIATDGNRYYLEGVSIERRDLAGRERLVMVATNGTEIGIASRALPAGAERLADCILPRKAAALIGHAAKLADPTEEIEVQAGERFGFTIGNVEIIAKAIDGTFPEWQRVFESNLAPTGEAECDALFPDLLPGGAATGKLEKLAKAAGAIEWSDAAEGKTGAVAGDPDLLFGVMNTRDDAREPVKGFRYSTEADADNAGRYLRALAEARGVKPSEPTRLIVENGVYRGLTVGKSEYRPARYEERPNFETLTMEQVEIPGGLEWAEGSHSILMPSERAKVRQDYSVTVEGDREYPIAVNSSATKIHLSAAQVRDLVGEDAFETISFTIGGQEHHVSKWLWDDGATRLGTVQSDGRTFPHYHKKGFDYSSDSVSFTRAEIEAALRGEIVEEIEAPEIVATEPHESEEAVTPVHEGAEPVEALNEAQRGPEPDAGIVPEYPEPDQTGSLDAQGECMAAFIETLEPLPAQSAATPTAHAKRSPAHERAIRRAWAERSASREAERHIEIGTRQLADKQQRIVDLENAACVYASGMERRLTTVKAKRRRAVLKARDYQRQARNMHESREALRFNLGNAESRATSFASACKTRDKEISSLKAELAKARQVPTYFDETGMERQDAATTAYHQGRHALDKAEGLERQLSEARAAVDRQQRAIEGLSAEYEAMATRALKAERDLAAVEARLNGWPPAVRTVGVNFALAG